MTTTTIKTIISNFTAAGDEQNFSLVAPYFIESSRILNCSDTSTNPAEIKIDTFKMLLEAKKIGGVPREIEITSINETEVGVANATAILTSDTQIYTSQYNFMKINGEWKILTIILSIANK